MTASELLEIVEKYLAIFPNERKGLGLFLKQLAAGHEMNNRKTLPGHATGSAIVLSPDRTKILLIYHKLFKDWYQPGGHWDSEEASPWEAARREAEEETSVRIEKLLPAFRDDFRIPINISSHPIPARPEKAEVPHTHHDFRYVFLAASTELSHQEAEVQAAGWFEFDAPEASNVQAVIAKLKQQKII